MSIEEARRICSEFGEFYANRLDNLVVLEDGTLAKDFQLPSYFSVWDLPYSPARIQYAILYVAEHAVLNNYMDFIALGDERENSTDSSALPVGNVLQAAYGFLAEFIEDAHKINGKRLSILSMSNKTERDAAIIGFEVTHKLSFKVPTGGYNLRADFANFLADLHNNWH